ncbi:energy-coupling factor transporter transmembrane protein EcfT [Peptoniphilus sp. KCTC 25270]|uniref:energy-coupling factor transporter transmembrane component T n=1 Tax=Peptoniphilus sp. KCTC 25270 TaxID=2897414 RepID=UPI001E3F621D|nr:energy-coupling factor transporter transmembrane component T [Peptoniphilus sp. KCTC 25270]MCD1146806.1 energy-coupling factor transporter transmembrane protein EcfT [Peptoniphilus sp. KCTC 25270]
MKDFFREYHPMVNGLYYLSVIGIAMFTNHPVLQWIGFLGSFSYLIIARSKKDTYRTIAFSFATFLLIAILNPIFNHGGVTILGYLWNGNPFTLESVAYGISAGFMFMTVLLWFGSHNEIMTSDKLMYLFGKLSPAFALLFSMSLRFVPMYKRRIQEISMARKGLGREIKKGNWIQKLKEAFAIFSIFVTWALESSIETADSMKSRGFGLRKRTNFSLFRFTKRDGICLLYILFLDVFLVWMTYHRLLKMVYYPMIKIANFQWITAFGMILYLCLCMLPVLICTFEEIRWKYYM